MCVELLKLSKQSWWFGDAGVLLRCEGQGETLPVAVAVAVVQEVGRCLQKWLVTTVGSRSHACCAVPEQELHAGSR